MVAVVRIRPDQEWIDVTDRIRHEAGVSGERGRERESDTTTSNLTFVAENSDLWWSSDIPGTANYRKLGRGTPIDWREPIVTDTFAGSATDSWGSTEDPAIAWQQTGTATDYQRTAGVGRHILTSTGTVRSTWLDVSMRDCVIRGSVQVEAVATGAQYRYAVVCRRKDSDAAHYRAELRFQTSGAVNIAIARVGGTADVDLVTGTLTGTYTAATTVHYEFIADGNQLLMKAWFDGDGEPATWYRGYDDDFTFGDLGVRTVRDTSNTNNNLQLDTLSFEVSQPRFAGEIWSLTPMQDPSGNDITMTVEASGILRRLSNTAKPIRSALFRSIRRGAGSWGQQAIGYWPLEDGSLASQLEVSSLSGAAKPGYFSGNVQFGSDSTLPGSAPLPSVSTGGLIAGSFPAFPDDFDASTDSWALNFVVKIDEPPDVESVIARFGTSTEAAMYEVAMDTDGNLIFRTPKLYQLLADTYVFSDLADYDGPVQPGEPSLFGRWVRIRIDNLPFGPSNYLVELEWADAAIDNVSGILESPTGTTVWQPPNGAWQLFGPPSGSRAFGHVSAHVGGVRYTAEKCTGYAGELAADRIERLFDEEEIAADTRGGGSVSMGPQPQGTLLEAIEDAQSADLGVLVEPRVYRGAWYQSHTRLYNQLPAAIVDLANSELTDGFAPVRDDASGLANHIEATREGGTPQEYTIADGDVFHLTTEEPPDGISLAPASVSPNVQDDLDAAAQASWHAHLRAWREPRYEELRFRLHSSTYRADPQLTADVGGLEVGDMIQLDNQPAWAPPDPVQLIVQGIKEYSDTVRREITLTCTPYVPWEVWCLNTSGSTVAVAATSGATTLRVATSSGPEWQTSPDPPFLIQVNGEGIRVTGCTTDTPSYVGVGAASHGDNATVAPALPASLQTGDLMIAVAAIRNTAASIAATPTGWTVLSSAYNAFRVYGRYYVSGDTAPSFTFSGGAAGDTTSAFVAAFRNLSMEDSDARFGATTDSPENQSNSSAQNIAYPAMSVRRDGGVVLYVGWKQDDMTSATGPGDAEIIEASTTTGSDQLLVAYYDIQTTATDVTAGSITVTGGASAISRTVLLALRPLQTFTVERSLNGVAQAITAGEAINVWRHGAVPL
jgi:hypothetical protein